MQRVAVKVHHLFSCVTPCCTEDRAFFFLLGVQEEISTHASHMKALQKYHEADISVISAKAGLEKIEAEIGVRLAKVQAELNKLRVRAQRKVDRAIAEAEKAKADVRARENHREASRRHSEQMTGRIRDKRKEVEVLRGWKAVDDVGVSLPPVTKLSDAKSFTEGTRSQTERVKGSSASHHKLNICPGVDLFLLHILKFIVSPIDQLRTVSAGQIICIT